MFKDFFKKFFSGKKLTLMPLGEGGNALCRKAANLSAAITKDNFFQDETKYLKQDKATRDAYFNELLAGFLVMIKLLLYDYYTSRDNSPQLKHFADNIYDDFFNFLNALKVDDIRKENWLQFLEIKEQNVIRMKEELTSQIIQREDDWSRLMIEVPENLILQGTAFDTLLFFSKKERAGETNDALKKYLLDVHGDLFETLKEML